MSAILKKWLGIFISFITSTIVLYWIAIPIIITGMVVYSGEMDGYNKHPFLAWSALIVAFLLPIIVLGFIVYKFLHKDILQLASEGLDETGEPILINLEEEQNDEVNRKIVNAFKKAKKNLGIEKDIKLIRMVNSPYINAFALSNTKGEAAVVVFDGLATSDIISEDMMQAVIGHELGHIKNKDSITKVVLYANQYALPILEGWSDKINSFALNFAKDIPWVGLILYSSIISYKIMSMIILFPSKYIIHFTNLFVSRESEHLADKAGVEASSKESTLKLLKVFEKLEDNEKTESNKNSLYEFLASTHPPTKKRIEYVSNL